MNLFTSNPDLFPTNDFMIIDMWHKIPKKDRNSANFILDPNGGTGAIIDYLKEKYRSMTYHAIESDPSLIAMLRGKGIPVIGYDFLTYSGPDKYDIIMMNPPFSEGDKHLLKAIDIMYSGHIVCLLNAETIRNPYTNTRRMLIAKLEELKADIEFKAGAFKSADRKTSVDIAIVHIHIDRDVETELFNGVTDTEEVDPGYVDPTGKEITQQDSIENIVADYNRRVAIGTQTLIDYYRNHRHIGGYIWIRTDINQERQSGDLTDHLKQDLNLFLKNIRKSYWEKVLLLDKVRERMTVSKRKEFEQALQDNSFMDFTESNIRQFIMNLINSYDEILTQATTEIFDKMTKEYAWDEGLHNKNVHYFNGWKTNKAFFVNEKVIIPFYYQEAFWDESWNKWRLGWRVTDELDDIDKVMNYFDGRAEYVKASTAIHQALESGQTKKIDSTYFTITVYKKGTCHLTFKDEGIRRRFNVTACRGKSWLPQDYGAKKYTDLSTEEKDIVDTFEGKASYSKNVTGNVRSLFATKQLMQIPFMDETAN